MIFKHALCFLFTAFFAYSYAQELLSPSIDNGNQEYQKGIESTKHNLASYKGRFLNPGENSGHMLALCMWCHVQHVEVSFVEIEYRWAPDETVGKFYVYGQTKKGPVIEKIAPSSMVCLSCHDGANAPNIVFDRTENGYAIHSHPVFVIYKKDAKYLKPYNSPLLGWKGKKVFVYDLIKEYKGRIQCASCHDPHVDNYLFLRTNNRGSALCLGCHDL